MKPIFVDTAALIALGNQRDKFHTQAARLFKQYTLERRKCVTTNAVLLELTNAFSSALHKPLALQLIHLIVSSPQWNVVYVDKPLMERGLQYFSARSDKDWSLVDCIGMLVAQDWNITEIFTNDHHFEQAGFVTLLSKSQL